MRVERGASQILFGFLPGQTVDLNGGVWRVAQWNEPPEMQFDQGALRAAVLDQARPWLAAGMNDGICGELLGGAPIEVVRLNRDNGIEVEAFPRIWRCRGCGRLGPRATGKCVCGGERRAQLHYVQFHACGVLQEPAIPRCPAHGQVAMSLPGSSSVRDLPFFCPVCKKSLGQGFPFRNCSCGMRPARLDRNVHRAAVVFTPRFAVLVNAADPATSAKLRAGGGGARAMDWILDGMSKDDPLIGPQTFSGLVDSLVRNGLSPETARELAARALEKGEVRQDQAEAFLTMTPHTADAAQEEAFGLAAAVLGGRTTVDALVIKSSPPLKTLYEAEYRPALAAAKLEAIDFLPRFPVATLAFGYTRGDPSPGSSRLVAFRERGRLRAYGELQPTEALLFRMRPLAVHAWLAAHEVNLPQVTTDREARTAILEAIEVPRAIEQNPQDLGRAVVELVHSYAHRAIRRLASFAGIDREGISEYLLPHHLAFVVYATSRGFVLGGLQAVFETALDRFLNELVNGETRCALDPGCRTGGGACVACLHLGEPSCRWYNKFLDRARLFGTTGFLR